MIRRDDATEAAARALWATGGTSWEEANADEREYHRDCAEVALDAALAVLQPVIPNTTEDLEALPVGTIIRADLAAHDAELRAQIAAELIPTVAHKGPSDTDLDMLSRAATNLDQGYVLGGSNVTRAVAQLIHNAVTIARQEQP